MNKHKQLGFTLVELLAAIAILAIILAIALPGISGIISNATKAAFESNAKLVLKSIDMKKLENGVFDVTVLNKGNVKNLLSISDENYDSLNVTEVNILLFIKIVGQGKWDNLTACGIYNDMKVTNGDDCSIDYEAPVVVYNPNGSTNYVRSSNVKVTVSEEHLLINSLHYVWTNSEIAPSNQEYTTTFTSGDNIQMPNGNGAYYLCVIAKDTYNNTAISKSNVFNLDNEKPIITINGQINVTTTKGSSYTDEGVIISDNIDVNISPDITSDLNVNQVGTYFVTYNATDSSGNSATSVTRTVNVVDVSAPVITILGSNPATLNAGSVYSDAGATAIDDVNGNVTSNIITTGAVNPNVLGTYTIIYTVEDTAGNEATATRIINVIDNIVPTIAFGTNGNSTYAKTRSTTVTVSDNVAVNTSSLKYQWTISITTPTEVSFATSFTNGGTLSTPASVTGGYYLWILAKDTTGNTTITRTNIFNLDNTKPVITLTGSSTVTINVGSTYSDAGATATDNISTGLVLIPTSTVNPNVVGTYTVTYNVSDGAGNAAVAVVRTVNVIDNIPPTVSINASPTSITAGQNTTLTLTSNKDVGSTIYYLKIYDQTTGVYLASAGSGTTLSYTYAPSTTQTYVARATDSTGGTVYSSSSTVTVNVSVASYTLTTIASTGGTVSSGGTYNTGSTPTITATPNANYTFSSWSGSTGCSGTASHTITMDANKTCTANFTLGANWLAIGTQVWAKANLNVGTMVTGTTTQTNNSILEKHCYNDTESNCTTYGALYQWGEAMQYVTTNGARGICPAGSHFPSDNDWKILEVQLGMTQAQADATGWRGTDQGTQLKSGGSSGLNMPLAGFRYTGVSFFDLSSVAYLWSSSEYSPSAWRRRLTSGNATVGRDTYDKGNGFSVRCLGN